LREGEDYYCSSPSTCSKLFFSTRCAHSKSNVLVLQLVETYLIIAVRACREHTLLLLFELFENIPYYCCSSFSRTYLIIAVRACREHTLLLLFELVEGEPTKQSHTASLRPQTRVAGVAGSNLTDRLLRPSFHSGLAMTNRKAALQ
jgi:hypothetical protein